MNKLLRVIGKGQVTIPQEWRAFLNLEANLVKATLKGNQVILESVPLKSSSTWRVEQIALNQLGKEDQSVVREGRKAYKKGATGQFMSASDFFDTHV